MGETPATDWLGNADQEGERAPRQESLDIEFYKHAKSLPEEKKDPKCKKNLRYLRYL